MAHLDFEQPVIELEGKIQELQRLHADEDNDINLADEVARLNEKVEKQLRSIYKKLTPWQKVQVARHSERPRLKNFLKHLLDDFTPLAGDRLYGEDAAITAGLARFNGHSVMVIGQERGNDLQSRLKHNFGMPRPEGYRKAQRLMRLAERFKLPILTFIDTPGAYPGVGAEERGQAEAIAKSIETCLDVKVPMIATIIGEGGSGGAIAIGVADRILMMEHAVYSVISPEGCASILWRSATHASDAAEALKITAQDLLQMNIIDEIIQEPLGGAHRSPDVALNNVKTSINKQLASLLEEHSDSFPQSRREKFLAMGSQVI